MAEDPSTGGPKAAESEREGAHDAISADAPTNADRPRARPRPQDSEEEPPTAAEPGRAPRAKVTNVPSVHDVLSDNTVATPVAIEKGQKLGRYLILDKLGEGGMGVVHAAYDPELDRKVALKILSGRFNTSAAGPARQRLIREAQAMARVAHPNVVAVYDVGATAEGQIFVAMELVEGGTLNRWFKDTQRSWKEILKAFVEAGKGLAGAHAAGLVHRDFKPDNVLVSKDGRVQVTDFGLARLVNSQQEETPLTPSGEPERPRSVEESSRMLEAQLTQVGAVMGTPAYMSPEQHLGEIPDARSDQFSFCAALYWALFRKRPFDPQVLAAVAGRALIDVSDSTKAERPTLLKERGANPEKGVIHDPPKDPKVPKYVRRALMRGLCIDPDDRFPSMEALLKALSRDPRVVQRRYVIAATTAMILGVGVVTFQQVTERQNLCSGAERKVASVWSAQRRDQVASAFDAIGQPWAKDAKERVLAHFDGYTQSWGKMHRDACEATRLRGEQSEQVMSLRMICLERRLREVSELGNLIQKGDPAVLVKAQDAAYSLTPVARCADLAALTAAAPRPEDPETQQKIDQVEKLLAEVKAQTDAGRRKSALEVAQSAADQAAKIGWAPLEAEALNWLGALQPVKVAESTLKKAILAAEVGHSDRDRLLATSRLVYEVGYRQTRADDGLEWFLRGEALLKRIGENKELQAELLNYEGNRLLAAGRLAEAAKTFEAALALAKEALPPAHPRLGNYRINLASVYGRMGEVEKALTLAEDSLAFIIEQRGPNHPSAGDAHYTMAFQLLEAGQYRRADEHIQKSLQIREAAYGKDDLKVGDAHDIASTIYKEMGRFDEALSHAERSLAIKNKTLGKDHVDLAYAYENLGQALIGLGRSRDAIGLLEKAIRLRESEGLAAIEIAEPRFALARAVWAQSKDRRRAVSLANLAKDAYAQSGNMKKATTVAKWVQESLH